MAPFRFAASVIGAYALLVVGLRALDPELRSAAALFRAIPVTVLGLGLVVGAHLLLGRLRTRQPGVVAALQGGTLGLWVAVWDWAAYAAAPPPSALRVAIGVVAFAAIAAAVERYEARRRSQVASATPDPGGAA